MVSLLIIPSRRLAGRAAGRVAGAPLRRRTRMWVGHGFGLGAWRRTEREQAMAVFTDAEREYLAGQWLARLATASADGQPDVSAVGFSVDGDTIVSGGLDLTKTVRYRHLQSNPRASLVVDDLCQCRALAAPRGESPRPCDARGRRGQATHSDQAGHSVELGHQRGRSQALRWPHREAPRELNEWPRQEGGAWPLKPSSRPRSASCRPASWKAPGRAPKEPGGRRDARSLHRVTGP